jgi:hypothetical protein
MKVLRTFTFCAAVITALVLTSRQAAADLATAFVETTPVGETSKEYGYLVSTDPSGTHFLVIVTTDELEHLVLRGVADKGVVKDSVLGKLAVIEAQVLEKKRDEKRGRVDVKLKITRVWPYSERKAAGKEGPTRDKAAAEPTEIDTPEIIRILENEAIAFVGTWHSQRINIKLKDGRTYFGIYEQKKAGKYSKDPKLFDILNLTTHIFGNRPRAETKDIERLMQ